MIQFEQCYFNKHIAFIYLFNLDSKVTFGIQYKFYLEEQLSQYKHSDIWRDQISVEIEFFFFLLSSYVIEGLYF